MTITPGQAKAARELLGWAQEVLAACLGIVVRQSIFLRVAVSWAPNLHREKILEVLEASTATDRVPLCAVERRREPLGRLRIYFSPNFL